MMASQQNMSIFNTTKKVPKKSSLSCPMFFHTQTYKYLMFMIILYPYMLNIFHTIISHRKTLNSKTVRHSMVTQVLARIVLAMHKHLGSLMKALTKFTLRQVKLYARQKE